MSVFASIPAKWFDYLAFAGVFFCLGYGSAGSGTRCWIWSW